MTGRAGPASRRAGRNEIEQAAGHIGEARLALPNATAGQPVVPDPADLAAEHRSAVPARSARNTRTATPSTRHVSR